MNERENPEVKKERSSPHAIVMEHGSEQRQAFLYNEPGWLDLASESTSGLSLAKPGRSLLVTEEGRFAVVRGYLVDIEQSLHVGTTILHPLPHWLRQECMIAIGQKLDLGEVHLPVVREVFVDRMAAARPDAGVLRLQDPFKGEVEAVTAHIGVNEERVERSMSQPPLKGDYL
ncbi:MAG TPA: hypothetical protein VFT87_02355 [Candidatus Saccharimonadales bacterium]|nr:hypothetical protein [Candidatus Saccharimonadales bacterium]